MRLCETNSTEHVCYGQYGQLAIVKNNQIIHIDRRKLSCNIFDMKLFYSKPKCVLSCDPNIYSLNPSSIDQFQIIRNPSRPNNYILSVLGSLMPLARRCCFSEFVCVIEKHFEFKPKILLNYTYDSK